MELDNLHQLLLALKQLSSLKDVMLYEDNEPDFSFIESYLVPQMNNKQDILINWAQ